MGMLPFYINRAADDMTAERAAT
ncbi:MAG: hypothetical protein ABW184_15840 [Sphingobium sp.]